MGGKGNYEYSNFDITRVAEPRDDGTVFIWSRYGQPTVPQPLHYFAEAQQEQEQDDDEEDQIGDGQIDAGQDGPPVDNVIVNGGANQGNGDDADGSDSSLGSASNNEE